MDADDQTQLRSIGYDPLAADVVKPDLLIIGMQLDAFHSHLFDLTQLFLIVFLCRMEPSKRQDPPFLETGGKPVDGGELGELGHDRERHRNVYSRCLS